MAGLMAEWAGRPRSGTATLRKPTPVGTAVTLIATDGGASVSIGGVELATLSAGVPDGPLPARISWQDAVAAAPSYIGLVRHPFPGCVVCGTGRSDTDALCLRPGRISTDVVASPWQPAAWTDDGNGHVRIPAVWAALDCPSAWAIDDEGRAVVLGRITVEIFRVPRVAQRLVVVGCVRQRASRRIAQCGCAIYDEAGAVLAVASSTWFAVDIATFAR